MAERVLVVAPHPDDESIGCGGAILDHRQHGDEVAVVFLTSGEGALPQLKEKDVWSIREEEARRAAEVLGVRQLEFLRLPDRKVGTNLDGATHRLEDVLDQQRPSLIYVPHPRESHPDHAATLPVMRAALMRWVGQASCPALRTYEVWTPLESPGRFLNVSALMLRKLQAIRCYRSQLAILRYDRAIRGLNHYRGIMAAGTRYAEAFQDETPFCPPLPERSLPS